MRYVIYYWFEDEIPRYVFFKIFIRKTTLIFMFWQGFPVLDGIKYVVKNSPV